VGRHEAAAVTISLLMLLYNQPGRGTYWRALGFAGELSRRNYEVTMLVAARKRRRGAEEQSVNGVRLVEAPDLAPGSGYDLWAVANRLLWLRQRPFDLIHAFETRPVNILPALYARKRYGMPLITDWCDWFGRDGSVEQRSGWLLRTFLRPIETFFEEHFRPRAAGTTVINSVLYAKALALGVPPGDLLLLPNGANVTEIRPACRQTVRARLGLPQNVPILGYTGALFAEDAHLMAAAFDRIQAQQPGARLLLIGYTNIAVESLVATPANVLRTGAVRSCELADYVAACDIGWLPLADNRANRGRFPMKVHDFMAAGRPLVVSQVGDLGPFVRKWEIGLAAEAAGEALAEAVLDVLARPDELARLGRRARQVAEEQFAWPLVAARLDRFYQEIIGR
jgi:glycosyltransferase involved in cell wall biosynthesis